MLLHAASQMFEMDFYAQSEIVLFAIQEIAQHLIQRATAGFGEDFDAYQLERERFLTEEEFGRIFANPVSRHSLLFCIKQHCFALCVDQLPLPDGTAD